MGEGFGGGGVFNQEEESSGWVLKLFKAFWCGVYFKGREEEDQSTSEKAHFWENVKLYLKRPCFQVCIM